MSGSYFPSPATRSWTPSASGAVTPAGSRRRPIALILPSLFFSDPTFYTEFVSCIADAGYCPLPLTAHQSHDVGHIQAALLSIATRAEASGGAVEVAVVSFGTSGVFACNALSYLARGAARAPGPATPHTSSISRPGTGAWTPLLPRNHPPLPLSEADYEKLGTWIHLKRLVFVGAWVLPAQMSLWGQMCGREPRWLRVRGSVISPRDPEQTLFAGFPQRAAMRYSDQLDKSAPFSLLTVATSYEAYRYQPTSYLVLHGDPCLPPQAQSGMALEAGINSVRELYCGRVAVISDPVSVAALVHAEIGAVR